MGGPGWPLGEVPDAAMWAVPFGIIGARVYHVATDWSTYFGPDGTGLVAALKMAGRPGHLGCRGRRCLQYAARRMGFLLPPMADAVAPGIAVAQAIGRWGNWFNQGTLRPPH